MNLDSLTALAGQSVSMRELQDLNKALNAAGSTVAKATAGYPTQGVAGTGSFAPLVPQSIQSTLDSATYTDQAIKVWKKLTKVNVTSPLHESTVVSAYGNMDLDPFIAEGSNGTNSDGTYERKIVKVKYLAEQREISDVATMAGIIGYSGGVSRQGLAQQTIDGTKALMGKLERALYLGSSIMGKEGASGEGLQFDGLYQQISGATYDGSTGAHSFTAKEANYKNLDGAELTPQDLIEQMYQVSAAPNYGYVNTVLVDPRTYAKLVNIATSFGRFQMSAANSSQLVFGSEGLAIAGPGGMVGIEQAPLAAPRSAQSSSAGTTGSFTMPHTGVATAASGTSKFSAADAGTYFYRIVGVGDKGLTAPVKVLNAGNEHGIAVAAGEKVTFTLEDAAVEIAGASGIRYYRVYRSKAGAADGEDATYMWQFPRNPTKANKTVIIDENLHRPDTGQAYLLQMDPSVMYWAQLLDFLRRPLAQSTTSVPFLLMLFGSLHVKVPTKCAVIDNVSF